MSEEPRQHPRDPLHGVTLETILRRCTMHHEDERLWGTP